MSTEIACHREHAVSTPGWLSSYYHARGNLLFLYERIQTYELSPWLQLKKERVKLKKKVTIQFCWLYKPWKGKRGGGEREGRGAVCHADIMVQIISTWLTNSMCFQPVLVPKGTLLCFVVQLWLHIFLILLPASYNKAHKVTHWFPQTRICMQTFSNVGVGNARPSRYCWIASHS